MGERDPQQAFARALYIAAAVTVAIAIAIAVALLGQAFPGTPEDPDSPCGAPGAAGCNPGDTWTLMAIVVGGILGGPLVVAAVLAQIMGSVRSRR